MSEGGDHSVMLEAASSTSYALFLSGITRLLYSFISGVRGGGGRLRVNVYDGSCLLGEGL